MENISDSKSVSPEIAGRTLFKKIESYDPDFDKSLVLKAIDFAIKHHGDQKRHSGDPYYYHPIEVAEILSEMKLDTKTIITAILHDTVEDTTATLEDIEHEFGKDVRQLVDGVTKLTRIEFQSDNHKQAENFRKLLVAISEDIRVLMVKLADRLHNMRTLHHIAKPEKRHRIAMETMEVYAPLAERIGMQRVKDELQNIAFIELHPDGYSSIQRRLKYLRETEPEMMERTVSHLNKLLEKNGVKAQISSREKRPYSIWQKMQKKNVGFEQLADIIAFRIIVDTIEDCYRALGVIHGAYHMIPEYFDDFISTPKNNGYQSVHTVVMGPEQQRIEIQIRTHEMHKVAEMGVAAHWSYKQDRPFSKDGREYQWIRELMDIIEHTQAPEEFLENTKLEMYHDQVFCFTPRGDLIALPKGATPVDFAFAVHSEVGRTCVGSKINGRIMPLRTQIKNGDQVEIIQSKSQQPSPSWEHFVVTGKAKSEIRRFIKTQQRGEYIILGKGMLAKALQAENKELHDSIIEPLVKQFSKQNVDDIYAAIGEGSLERSAVIKALFPEDAATKKKASLLSRFRFSKTKKPGDKTDKVPVPIMGLIPGMAIHYAGCCHPLPGEKIVGIVNSGKGITIHTEDCSELENFVDQPERWVDVAWEKNAGEVFVGRLKVVLMHKKGSLATLANTIAKGEGNINNLRIVDRSSDFFEMIVDVEVRDVEHLLSIMALLRSKGKIHSVERYSEGKQ